MSARHTILALMMFASAAAAVSATTPAEDKAAVAALDTKYQAAVKKNDAETMGQILDDNFILVLGNGTVVTRNELLAEARGGKIIYEHQEEDAGTQTVRVWGDTAVVTARLWLKYTTEGKSFDRRLWFSDTYVRTASGGWRYVFGQASLALPPETAAKPTK